MFKAVLVVLLLGPLLFIVLPASTRQKGDDILGFLGSQSGTQALSKLRRTLA
jgi:hypothetical protein